jgi:uncharacterized protein (DUF433 family)
MPAAHDSLLERITIDSDVRFGKPCIRGHRITVQEILEWLSSGASQQQILADYPQIEPDDFLAVYAYAAELAADAEPPEDEAELGEQEIVDAETAAKLDLARREPGDDIPPEEVRRRLGL